MTTETALLARLAQLEDALAREASSRQDAQAEARLATETRKRFLASMSHELRTPLNGLIGASEFVLQQDLPVEARDCVQLIHKSSLALCEVLTGILDLARLESGHLQLLSEVFDVRAAMATTVARFAPAASGKKLTLSLSAGGDEPLPVVGDEHRFCQVLGHLVGNAVKFTDEGTVAVSLQAHQRPDRICELIVCVRDTGTGIRPEDHERIFSVFGLGDPGDPGARGGPGLGLSVSRELAGLMGGALGVSSVLGRGTTFIFRLELPLGAPAAGTGTDVDSREGAAADNGVAAARPSPNRPAEDGGWTVLLVEDNPVNRAVAVHILTKAGCRIDVAENGAIALEMTRVRRYDAIFMDLQMPVMDGLQATRAIRCRESDGSRVPIIAVTANVMPGDRETCLTAGMDDYVPKPLRSSDLVDALYRWCAGAPQPA